MLLRTLRRLALRGLSGLALCGALTLGVTTPSIPSATAHAAPLVVTTAAAPLAPAAPVAPLAPTIPTVPTALTMPTSGPVLLWGPVQNGSWMCEHWYDAGWWYTHCTQAFTWSGGHLISLNPAWVPNFHGGPAAVTSTAGASGEHEPDGDADDGVVSQTVTASGSVAWRGGSSDHYPWGWCTFAAAHLAYDNVDWLGNAKDWLANAQARGMPTGTTPRLNATVVFQPGVDGASALGHVAHVVRVYSDGSFDSESMAQPTWGVYTITHHRMQWGIAFIY